ncbi:ADP-ribosylation factor-like protein 2-binding protein [Tribolium madens]|uniref:ADP-ribosylation factor-like protein 2-binding protein n=1 Tax=Tribolium madens TaxID=41895 RepID=UPI001CF75AC4|nr:ADP-ribosylation factor-like protein 2-binding protein [Tribolium madens]
MAQEQCFYEGSADDLDISHHCLDVEEKYFAQVVGHIEDILLDDSFLKIHKDFMEEYWKEFEENEENKLIYTEIFKKYVETIEKFLESELKKKIPNFSMLEFEYELRKRPNELVGEVFEILATFTDFVSFKEKFLDYKAMKEGKTVDFSKDLYVVQYKLETL